MQLLVLILKKIEFQAEIMKQLAEAGVKGGTVFKGNRHGKNIGQSLKIFPLLEC